MTKLISILLILGLTSISIHAKTCGQGPAVASFEADVYNKIENKGQFQTSYASWKTSAAAEPANAKVPKPCESLFTGKKSCCIASTLPMFNNIYQTFLDEKLRLGGSFFGFGPKKNFKADALEGEISSGFLTCMAEYIKKHPELNNTASGSASMSMSMSMSMSVPPSVLKAEKAVRNVEKQAEGLIKKAVAELGLMSFRLFRGTVCALCMDPDAVLATIWDNGVLVKEADVTAIKEKVKKNLVDSVEGAKEKHKVVKLKNRKTLELLECSNLIKKIDDYQPEDVLCPNDAGCTKTADAAVTSAWVVNDDSLTTANPTSRRELQASSTLKPSASATIGGQTEDATEDAVVKIDGKSPGDFQTEATAADTELKAEPLNEADAEALYGPTGSSNLLAVTLSVVAFLLVSLL